MAGAGLTDNNHKEKPDNIAGSNSNISSFTGNGINQAVIDRIIINALNEDMPYGDITTEAVFSGDNIAEAVLKAKEDGVIAGIMVAERVFRLLDDKCEFTCHIADGSDIKCGKIIAAVRGRTEALLKGERTALNLLQRMSGIATLTRAFCDKVEGLPVKITDTRKTAPNLRYLEKYAVRAGGGYNHRFCLSDGALIKDNHIKAAGGIGNAVKLVKNKIPHTVRIEVETESIEQVREALKAGADIVMLDNMGLEMMAEAVMIIKNCKETKHVLVEASGNISLDNVIEIALTGVDIISVGKLTHSARALDISMKII